MHKECFLWRYEELERKISRAVKIWLQACKPTETDCAVWSKTWTRTKKDTNTFTFRLPPLFPKDKVYKNTSTDHHSIEPKKLSLQQTMRLRSCTVRGSQPWNYICFHWVPWIQRVLTNGALFQDIRPLSYLHWQKRWTQNTWETLSFSNYLCQKYLYLSCLQLKSECKLFKLKLRVKILHCFTSA